MKNLKILVLTVLVIFITYKIQAKDFLDYTGAGYNNLSGSENILPGGWIVPLRFTVTPGKTSDGDTATPDQIILYQNVYLTSVTLNFGTGKGKYIQKVIISTSMSRQNEVGSVIIPDNVSGDEIDVPTNGNVNKTTTFYVMLQVADTVPNGTSFFFTLKSA
ncbi:MAG TPA: hypothetical protein PLM75_07945, partial [bacterium]|nr:hypothetical protein [bacterium]